MMVRGFWKLNDVSDAELVSSLKQLVARSSWTEARIVAHLAELDARRLHLKAGRSLFRYCQEQLGLSQNEAHYRIQAARIARKFPIVFELLERREIHLTALALIRDYITAENHLELLREVSGKTKEQILHLLVTRAPRPDAKNRIRKLPVPAGSVAAGPTGALEPLSAESYRLQLNVSAVLKHKLELLLDLMSHANPSRDLAVAVERAVDTEIVRLQKQRFGQTTRPQQRRSSVEREKMNVTTRNAATTTETVVATAADRETREISMNPANSQDQDEQKQEQEQKRQQDQQRRQQDQVQEQQQQRQQDQERQQQRQPQQEQEQQALEQERSRNPPRSRDRIPNELRRQVVERDGLSCSFVGEDGRRCGARAFLQFDHEHAWAKGGSNTPGNLRLLCAEHNRLLAEREFGAAHVRSAIASRRGLGT